MKKFTCINNHEGKVDRAIEGTEEEVQAWMIDLNHTFVTSDHHFRYWKHPFHLHCESTEEEEREHIALWNSIVEKDDLVYYIGDFCDGTDHDLQEIHGQLNGRMILIKGNHDNNSDEVYRQTFEDVLEEGRIDELNLRLIHVKEKVEDLCPGERVIYGHEHRGISLRPPTTPDSICVCAKWHGWKPLTLAEAIRQMDAAAAGGRKGVTQHEFGKTHGGHRMKESKWSVFIVGIGVRVVEAKDIDDAYAAAMAAYGCRLEDILAVFSHTPFRVPR